MDTKILYILVGVAILVTFTGLFVTLFAPEEQISGQVVQELKALPYANSAPVLPENSEKIGVTINTKEAFDGLRLYSLGEAQEAHLIDNEGNIKHIWDTSKLQNCNDECDWNHVELFGDELFVLISDKKMMKLDWDGNHLWSNFHEFHHDIDISPEGEIFALRRAIIAIPCKSDHCDRLPILNDYISVIAPYGDIRREISLYDLFKDELNVPAYIEEKITDDLKENPEASYDLFHTNGIEILDADIPGVAKRGNVFISVRELDLIAIVDLDSEAVVWRWGPGELKEQHGAQMMDNGNILLFDNKGNDGFARILELDPKTNTGVWQYPEQGKYTLVSPTRGWAEVLENGNILITESDKGRAFEITRSGEVVWEFWNTIEDNERDAIYRMVVPLRS
ncbi:MAG: arylsulfotransferase family protein [Nanoarchaeota archaeon]